MSNNIDLYVQEIEDSKQQIKQAIVSKGVTPTGGLSSYPAAIYQIENNKKPELTELIQSIENNGLYEFYPEEGKDGFSSAYIAVDVPSMDVGGKQIVPNGFAFESGDMSQIDFSQYDWSMVYDGYQFFNATGSSTTRGVTNSTGDWSNFEQNFNGKLLSTNRMFYECQNLTSFPQLDTSNVLDMGEMFYNCSSLTAIPQLDTSNVVIMYNMFGNCKLTTIPQLNTSNVVNMEYMFSNCQNLTSIPLLDTSNVTNMNRMFNACSSLTSIPQLNTSNVLNMQYMFSQCSSLTSIPLLDTSKVASMSYMFRQCSSLTSIPLLDISKVASMSYMFYYCRALTDVHFKGNPSKGLSVFDMFNGVTTTGTLYYDSRYDYSKIIAKIPSTWTAVPYDVEEYESQLNQSN